MSKSKFRPIVFERRTEGKAGLFVLEGRNAWALMKLIVAGAAGVSPVSEPSGPRWSAYIHNLRRMGLGIATRHEAHGGAFPGTHARYVLTEEVRVVSSLDNA